MGLRSDGRGIGKFTARISEQAWNDCPYSSLQGIFSKKYRSCVPLLCSACSLSLGGRSSWTFLWGRAHPSRTWLEPYFSPATARMSATFPTWEQPYSHTVFSKGGFSCTSCLLCSWGLRLNLWQTLVALLGTEVNLSLCPLLAGHLHCLGWCLP